MGVPMWGEPTYNFTRDQIGYHNGTPWTIVVRREDEPLLLGGPRGRTSISSSDYYIRSLVWWARVRFGRRSQKAWRVIVFKGFPTPSESVGDALLVETLPTKSEAAKAARNAQADIGDLLAGEDR